MDRLTIEYCGEYVPKGLCSIDRLGGADDCDLCCEYCKATEEGTTDCSGCAINQCFNKLGEYEELEEKGLLLKPPCKEGYIVYDVVLCDDGEWHIFEMKVCAVNPFGDTRKGKTWNVYLECTNDCTKAYRSFYDFGRTVFLTQSEAEEALKKVRG